ncbi:hypothetical protein ABT214_32040, partial [Micromonospora purpureochromogenes]|uniref:hypothetical protein n=1 Tax=Micromonospora purpureochromogenes TaxID=47872 RepID=UPI0033225BDF
LGGRYSVAPPVLLITMGALLALLPPLSHVVLVLELDGPIAPLAIRRLDDEDAFSILMPIRL